MEIAHLTHHRLIKYQYAPKVALWHQQSSPCFLYPPGRKPFHAILPEIKIFWQTDCMGHPNHAPAHKYYRQSMLALSQKPITLHRRQLIEQRGKNVNKSQIDIAIRYLCHSIHCLIDLCHYQKRIYALCYILCLPASQSPQLKISAKDNLFFEIVLSDHHNKPIYSL